MFLEIRVMLTADWGYRLPYLGYTTQSEKTSKNQSSDGISFRDLSAMF